MKLGVTLVLTVTKVYVFVNLRRKTSPCHLKTLSLALALTLVCLNPEIPNPNLINPNLPNPN